jgi:hypothetical protein
MQPTNAHGNSLRACMVGMGMIFDETYRPMFETLHAQGLFRKDFGYVNVALASVATRTGARARTYKESARGRIADFTSFDGPDSVKRAIEAGGGFRLRGISRRPAFQRCETRDRCGQARADREARGARAGPARRAG